MSNDFDHINLIYVPHNQIFPCRKARRFWKNCRSCNPISGNSALLSRGTWRSPRAMKSCAGNALGHGLGPNRARYVAHPDLPAECGEGCGERRFLQIKKDSDFRSKSLFLLVASPRGFESAAGGLPARYAGCSRLPLKIQRPSFWLSPSLIIVASPRGFESLLPA